MGVPIAEFLATEHGKEVHSEVPHPLLDKKQAGRPPQLDFVRKKHKNEIPASALLHWHAAYECKYQKDTPERLLFDICRLLCLGHKQARAKIGTPKRYFVFAGKREDEGQPITPMINTGAGARVPVFDRILLRKKKNIGVAHKCESASLHPRQLSLLAKFTKSNGVLLPSIFTTELRGLSVSSGYSCSIWQIKAVSGSKLLDYGCLAK